MKNNLVNGDSGVNGLFRAKLIRLDGSDDIRAFIPGISSVNPFESDGTTINESKYLNNLNSFPKIQWCCYNLESKEYDYQNPLCWVMFENGDIKRPVVISYAVLFLINGQVITGAGGSLSGSVNAGFGGSGGDGSGFGGGNNDGNDLIDGKIVDALFTAYYATPDGYSTAENRLEGGPQAANGEWLDYTTHTCAAPPEVPFNTNIKVMETGTSQDGTIYRVNDRGGAIKVVNGVYHFDLLMKDKQTANAWGRRNGKAMIGGTIVAGGSSGGDTGGGIQGANATGVASTAISTGVTIANNDKNTYVRGGKGPNTFDCSGFVWYCYNTALGGGLSYASTSSMKSTYTQAGFKDVTNSVNLQTGAGLMPGDILLNSSGGHVDMYIGGGQRVGAHSSKTGIYVDNYGYNQSGYNNKYDCVLRYVG